MNKSGNFTSEIEKERALYADLAKAVPVGIYRIRVFSGESTLDEKWASVLDSPYKVEYANDRFFEILQFKREEYEKKPGIINHSIYEEDKPSFIAKNVEANRLMIPFVWEGRFMIQNQIIWIHFESIPRIMENNDIVWTGTLQDISKRKKGELEIVSKNEELQKLNQERTKFLSIIAHDLKTPFNSILNFSELLLSEIEEQDIEKVQEYGSIILDSSQRALSLLKNLMEWAQLHTGRLQFRSEVFLLDSEIEETILSFHHIAKEKNINIKNHILKDTEVVGDKNMIITVIRNLISNAIKFSFPKGIITISSRIKDDKLIFSISDTGVGISKKRLEKIFHLDGGTSTKGTNNEKGTGMGLILCKDFIEMNGGKIWVESVLGNGSTFYFTLPKALQL
ncbi:MAG TPA: PAS domain-containing sensor histidine kinase [Bacteroidales bacterium]|nr:PAS domain-containing sensor histidine kinase [Bacteroidales bacterium]